MTVFLRVWLDDERPIPTGYDTHAKTAQEAIDLIDTGNVSVISLDNHLGGELEGRHVAQHIEQLAFKGKIPKIRCRVHTADPVAQEDIKASLSNAYMYWMERREKV